MACKFHAFASSCVYFKCSNINKLHTDQYCSLANFIQKSGYHHCTMNIFGSKSGHLNNRIFGRFFFIFIKMFAVFDDFSKWRVLNVLQISGKIIKYSKNLGKMKKTLQFLLLFRWPLLEPKMIIVYCPIIHACCCCSSLL